MSDGANPSKKKNKNQKFAALSLTKDKEAGMLDDNYKNGTPKRLSIDERDNSDCTKRCKTENNISEVSQTFTHKSYSETHSSSYQLNAGPKSYDSLELRTKSVKEFDAFQTYLNNDKVHLSQLTQFLKSNRKPSQLQSEESASSKTQLPIQRNNENKSNDKIIFTEAGREEIEQFFDEVEHSISMLGEEKKNENLTQFLEVFFNISSLENNFQDLPSRQTILKVNENNESLINASIASNVSFFSALKEVFLSNASKSILPSPTKKLNTTILPQNQIEFKSLGPFYGLPLKVKELIKSYKGVEELYDWQDECLKLLAIQERKNLIYALPTSGGKTLVAEILMLREIMCYRRNALFILPFVAIVQEKVWALSPFGVTLEFLIEEYAASKGTYPPRKRRRKNSIYIATIEKALGLLNSLIETNRINEIGLIVVDELHLLGEQGRGPTLEALLTKMMFINANIQVVGMSATIGNINDLCKFLNAEVYVRNFRPVELTEYVKCGSEIAKINWSSKEQELLTVERVSDFGYSEAFSNVDPDRLGGLVMEVIPKGSCLIFCPSKKNCENVTYLLCRVVNKNLIEYKKQEKEQIKQALKDETGSLCKIFNISIQFGIAYHHSGLTNEERRIIEDGFRAGIISVICCTSTLAAGVNLPAQRVILRQPYVGRDFITLSKYKQMVGRAGRAGLGEAGDSILICTPQDLAKVNKLLTAPMDQALSSMHDAEGKGLRHLLLSCISLGIANTRLQLQNVTKKSLLYIQSDRLGVDLKRLTDRVISDLFKLGALQEADLTVPDSSTISDVTVRMDTSTAELSLNSQTDESTTKKRRKIVIKNNTKLVISKLGCAAIKGNFELTRAHMLYGDLYQTQKSLVLLDSLHLLYLVIPYDIAEQIKPNKNDYYNIYCELNSNELQTAKVLGIDDSVAMKMLSNQPIKNIPERILNRFYLALMLYDLWNEKTVFEVAEKYQINRGVVQNLMTGAATFASNVVNFCEGLEEFWTFSYLLKGICQRLSHCCIKELLPLMELPAVKQSRAKQLYNAGYKTLQSIAKANPEDLVQNIEFLPRRVAKQLIASAKMLLLEKVENLREEAEDVLDGA